MLITSVFLVPMQPHVEAYVLGVVKSGPATTTYGAQRIFGCIGLMVVTFAAGALASVFKMQDVSQYGAAIFVAVPCALLLIPAGCFILKDLQVKFLCPVR